MTGKWILAPATPHTPSPYPLTPQPQAPCSSSLQHLVWQTFTRNGSDGPETQHSLGSFLGRERTLACQLETTLAGIIFLPLFLFLSLFLSFCVWRGREDVKREKKKKQTYNGFKLHLDTMLSLSPLPGPLPTPHTLNQRGYPISAPAVQNMDSQASYSEDDNFSVRPVLLCFSAGFISLVLTCSLVITRPVQTGGALPNPFSPSSCILYCGFCYKLAAYP